jgi:hypothetical protein
MIKILHWKYRRKSTKCKNIFILNRFHDKIINLLSNGEDKSERKELDENDENSRRIVLTRGILFMGHCSPRVLFTRENTFGHLHRASHPDMYCSCYCSLLFIRVLFTRKNIVHLKILPLGVHYPEDSSAWRTLLAKDHPSRRRLSAPFHIRA